MKVLVLSNLYPPDFIGGYELACSQVVDALAERGHEVLVLASSPRRPVPRLEHVRRSFRLSNIYDLYCVNRSAPVTQRLNQAESHFINAHNVYELIRAVEEFGPDVAYVCNLTGLGGLGLMGCLEYLKVPWTWQLGDCIPALLCYSMHRIVPEVAREFERRLEGHFIVVSERLRLEIEGRGLRLPGEVHLLPNWIVGERPEPRASTYRPGDRLRIATAGQLIPEKGVDLLIEAAALLRDAGYDDFEVDVYGKIPNAHYPTLIRRLGMERHVRLPGPLPHADLMRRLADHDLFAFPTWEREPFGLAPLEAMARGCVPAITRSCGIGEWMVHGVHCLKAERSAPAFAGVFRDVIEGEIDLAPLARRGASVAWRDFHLERMIGPIESILQRASTRSRSGAGSADEAYRLALLAERLAQVLVQDSQVA